LVPIQDGIRGCGVQRRILRDGSFVPFALTRADRVASSDPRLSLEERYGTHSRYVELVREASERLVAERLLLREDAEAFIKLAEDRDLGLFR
jgi:hypothetical protein